MNDKSGYVPLDAFTIKELVAKIRKGQVWKKDVAKSINDTFSSVQLWMKSTEIEPGPYKTRANIVHRHYKEFCISKKINEQSIMTLNSFGELVMKERLFPRYVANREVFYNINKDIHTDADREKQKLQKEKKAAAIKKKRTMGIKAPDVQ